MFWLVQDYTISEIIFFRSITHARVPRESFSKINKAMNTNPPRTNHNIHHVSSTQKQLIWIRQWKAQEEDCCSSIKLCSLALHQGYVTFPGVSWTFDLVKLLTLEFWNFLSTVSLLFQRQKFNLSSQTVHDFGKSCLSGKNIKMKRTEKKKVWTFLPTEVCKSRLILIPLIAF